MYAIIAVVVGLILALVLGAIVAIQRGKKLGMEKETDYKTLYTLGISLIPLGIIFSATVSPVFIGFLIIGVVYMTIGIKNKDKWADKA